MTNLNGALSPAADPATARLPLTTSSITTSSSPTTATAENRSPSSPPDRPRLILGPIIERASEPLLDSDHPESGVLIPCLIAHRTMSVSG